MSSIEHDLKKNLIEASVLIELCASIQNLTRDWTKNESPDWTSGQDIGLEIVSVVPSEWRELYCYKSPADMTLAKVAAINYSSEGYGLYRTCDGETFTYYYNQKLIVPESDVPIEFKDLSQENHKRYDNALCMIYTDSSPIDLGNDALNYIIFAE